MHGRGGVSGRYYDIWLMSGRYAPYCNAMLFIISVSLDLAKLVATPKSPRSFSYYGHGSLHGSHIPLHLDA